MVLVGFVGLLILLGLAVFQLLLALGKPYGNFAWGGQHRMLPRRLRVASTCSILLYVVFGIFLSSKAGLVNIIPDTIFLTTTMWVFTGYFILGIFMNAISRSKKERMLMTPVAALLAIIFLLAALSE